jgi:hypothetical protein
MGLQIIAPVSTELAQIGTFAHEMGHRLGAVIQEMAPGIFDPYHPELHYMRGPGPKWPWRAALLPAADIAGQAIFAPGVGD